MSRRENSLQATVLVPTIAGRAAVLPYSLGSVLAQSVEELEVFVMGDGIDEPTRATVREIMARDPRVRLFDDPKDVSRGERRRHQALAEARGKIVCYLCDRDLMLPDHVATMLGLLAHADFAHTLLFAVQPDESFIFRSEIDLGRREDCRWIASGFTPANGIQLSAAAHTLDMYRRLPEGWRTTPAGRPTDIYMWEQFLAQPDCRAVSGTRPTILYFAKRDRADWTSEQKAQELARWQQRMSSPGARQELLQRVIDALAADRLAKARDLRGYRRVAHRLASVPVLGPAAWRVFRWLRGP